MIWHHTTCHNFPGYALHEKGSSRQRASVYWSAARNQERVISRRSTGRFLTPSVYIGFRWIRLLKSRSCQFLLLPRRLRGTGFSQEPLDIIFSPETEDGGCAIFEIENEHDSLCALRCIEINVLHDPSEVRKYEILCQPMEEQTPRLNCGR